MLKEEVNMKKGVLVVILVVSVLFGQNYSDNVKSVLNKAGSNRAELEKVISHYSENPADSLKLRAAYFLIGNMGEQFYAHFIIADSLNHNLHFNVLDYPNYSKMVEAWDSVEAKVGTINNRRDNTVYDYKVITADYLINNIDLAFNAWQNFPWAHHINFKQFCEYILPYRGSNEPIENWRHYFYKKYAWVIDSVKDKSDPVEATILINNDLRKWFKFDSRFYRQSTDQGLTEMLKNKMGRCEDMTNLAIYAMRAMGIPVTSDFTPYWAKTGNNHAWNTVINKNGKPVIFMGGLTNPGEYKLNQAKAKVYRKMFAKQKETLAAIIPDREKAPPYINRNNIIDVTKEYEPVADVSLILDVPVPDSITFAYIAVFNSGEWKALGWSKISKGNKVTFKNMGLDIAYLPVYYKDEKVIPAGSPFILDKNGKVIPFTPNLQKGITIKLVSTTRKVTKNATDNIDKAFFKKGEKYRLYYWNYGWEKIGEQTASDGPLIFKDVPSGALYWLVKENSKKEERIFTIDQTGKQIWW